MILARFNKPKGESGVPSRLLTGAVVMWSPSMLRPAEAFRKGIPEGFGTLGLCLLFSGEDAEFLTVGQFPCVATCSSVHCILLLPPPTESNHECRQSQGEDALQVEAGVALPGKAAKPKVGSIAESYETRT